MKKILTISLFCAVTLFISACSDENKKLSQDTFKFDIRYIEGEYYLGVNDIIKKWAEITLTANDNVEIKKITANHGACEVYDTQSFNKGIVDTSLISGKTPPKMCYEDIINAMGRKYPYCGDLIKWVKMSKENCKYKYDYDFDDDYNTINERLEKREYQDDIESCEKAKKIAKEKYDGKYYHDYKVSLGLGENKKFIIMCPNITEFSVYTNKGYVTYSTN